jgi:hypothetical protein
MAHPVIVMSVTRYSRNTSVDTVKIKFTIKEGSNVQKSINSTWTYLHLLYQILGATDLLTHKTKELVSQQACVRAKIVNFLRPNIYYLTLYKWYGH